MGMEKMDAEAALQQLIDGNRRFVAGQSQHPHETSDWRHQLEAAQHPCATVLGCSDSRVSPELIFDQGLGDLFVVRVAGNIVDVDVAASVEYALHHLGTRLVLVLGHSHCGAVEATVDHLADDPEEPPEISTLLHRIEPALVGLPQDVPRDEQVAMAVTRNVEQSVTRLARLPAVDALITADGARIVGAVYDMHTGEVNLLHPLAI